MRRTRPSRSSTTTRCDERTASKRPSVDHLISGLTSAGAKTDYVHLTGVNHVLKEGLQQDARRLYQAATVLTQFTAALASFVKDNVA